MSAVLNAILNVEDEWLSFLETFPEWVPEQRPLIVISPHPDDEVLGIGGFIASHLQSKLSVTVLAVTDGEAAYPDVPTLSFIREREQEKALNRLGLENSQLIRLRLPDSGVASHEGYLAEKIAAFLCKDSYVAAPWAQDPHPDHEACGRAAERAAASTGATLISYFFWTWHRLQPRSLSALPLRRFDLTPETRTKKKAALEEYRSQLEHENREPILPSRFLVPVFRSFESVVVHE